MRNLAFAALISLAVPTAMPTLAAEVDAVASFSILGDMVSRVGGDRVAVTTFLGPNADTNVCKNAWASDWAKKHGTTVAAAERYARRISTSPPTTLRINGQDYVFNAAAKGATVWSTCEASLKAARGAPAQARVSVQDPATAALIADLRAQNQRLTAENHRLKSLAYQNSEETDPAKLISNQAKVADLERRLDEAARPVTKTMIILATMVGLAGVVLGLFIGSKRWRRRPNRTIGS